MAGQPSIQPTPITSAAATAPETGATIQGETGAGAGTGCGAGSAAVQSRCRLPRLQTRGLGVRLRAPQYPPSLSPFAVSLVTSVASRSIVGGSRLGRSDSGSDP